MITADRYIYLGVVGLAIWAVWGVNRMYLWCGDRKRSGWNSLRRYILGGFVGLYLIAWALYSNSLTRKWNDSITIKQEMRDFLQSGVTNKTKTNEN